MFSISTFTDIEEIIPYIYFLTKMYPEEFKIPFEKIEFIERELENN